MLTRRQKQLYFDGYSIYHDILPMPTQEIDGHLCGIGLSKLKLNRTVKPPARKFLHTMVARTCSVCGQTQMIIESGHVGKRCRWCANGATGRARIRRNAARRANRDVRI